MGAARPLEGVQVGRDAVALPRDELDCAIRGGDQHTSPQRGEVVELREPLGPRSRDPPVYTAGSRHPAVARNGDDGDRDATPAESASDCEPAVGGVQDDGARHRRHEATRRCSYEAPLGRRNRSHRYTCSM